MDKKMIQDTLDRIDGQYGRNRRGAARAKRRFWRGLSKDVTVDPKQDAFEKKIIPVGLIGF